jgi:hypothetical protein
MLQKAVWALALLVLAQGCAYDADQYESEARDAGADQEIGGGDLASDIPVDIEDFSSGDQGGEPDLTDLSPEDVASDLVEDAPLDVEGVDVAPDADAPPSDLGDDVAVDLDSPDLIEDQAPDLPVDQGDDLELDAPPDDVGPDLMEDLPVDVVEDLVEDAPPVDLGPDVVEDQGDDLAPDLVEDAPPADMVEVDLPVEPTPELDDAACGDGLDNDQDGFVDCLDFDCSRNDAVTICPGEDNDETCSRRAGQRRRQLRRLPGL